MAKVKLFSGNALLISLKAMVVSIIVGLILWIVRSVVTGLEITQGVAMLIQLLTFIFGLLLWGFIANKWWNWN